MVVVITGHGFFAVAIVVDIVVVILHSSPLLHIPSTIRSLLSLAQFIGSRTALDRLGGT